MITVNEYIITDGDAMPINIRLDPENTLAGPQLFILESEMGDTCLTIKMLTDLRTAALDLVLGLESRKHEHKKNQQ